MNKCKFLIGFLFFGYTAVYPAQQPVDRVFLNKRFRSVSAPLRSSSPLSRGVNAVQLTLENPQPIIRALPLRLMKDRPSLLRGKVDSSFKSIACLNKPHQSNASSTDSSTDSSPLSMSPNSSPISLLSHSDWSGSQLSLASSASIASSFEAVEELSHRGMVAEYQLQEDLNKKVTDDNIKAIDNLISEQLLYARLQKIVFTLSAMPSDFYKLKSHYKKVYQWLAVLGFVIKDAGENLQDVFDGFRSLDMDTLDNKKELKKKIRCLKDSLNKIIKMDYVNKSSQLKEAKEIVGKKDDYPDQEALLANLKIIETIFPYEIESRPFKLKRIRKACNVFGYARKNTSSYVLPKVESNDLEVSYATFSNNNVDGNVKSIEREFEALKEKFESIVVTELKNSIYTGRPLSAEQELLRISIIRDFIKIQNNAQQEQSKIADCTFNVQFFFNGVAQNEVEFLRDMQSRMQKIITAIRSNAFFKSNYIGKLRCTLPDSESNIKDKIEALSIGIDKILVSDNSIQSDFYKDFIESMSKDTMDALDAYNGLNDFFKDEERVIHLSSESEEKYANNLLLLKHILNKALQQQIDYIKIEIEKFASQWVRLPNSHDSSDAWLECMDNWIEQMDILFTDNPTEDYRNSKHCRELKMIIFSIKNVIANAKKLLDKKTLLRVRKYSDEFVASSFKQSIDALLKEDNF